MRYGYTWNGMIDRWDSADNDDDTNLAMIYISLSENRKAEHDIIALMKLKLYGQNIHMEYQWYMVIMKHIMMMRSLSSLWGRTLSHDKKCRIKISCMYYRMYDTTQDEKITS